MSSKHYHDLETVFDFIDDVDEHGVLRFTPPEYVQRDLPTNKLEALREMMLSRFLFVSFIRIRLSRGAKWVEDFEAQASKNGDGVWECRINLAKAMLLPGVNSRAELAELRGFFEACRDHVLSVPAEFGCDVLLTNNRDGSGRVYGDVLARRSLGDSKAEPVPEMTAKLKEMVAASPALSAWLREFALTLGKVGPWSSWSVREEVLFPEDERPRRNFALERIRREREERQASVAGATTSQADAAPARAAAKP